MLENMKVELSEGEALSQKRDGEIFKDTTLHIYRRKTTVLERTCVLTRRLFMHTFSMKI